MRFRVLTYNIHRAIGVDRRFRPERIIRILESHEAQAVHAETCTSCFPKFLPCSIPMKA